MSSCSGPAIVQAVILLSCGFLNAGEMLISEDFEKLDLNSLPQGWRVSAPDEISIVAEPSGNKVLRIDHKGKGMAELLIPLNAEQVRGRTVQAKVKLKCPAGYEADPDKQRSPQVMITYRAKSGSSGLYAPGPPAIRDWVMMAPPLKLPADTSSVTVSLRVNGVVCEAFFDNLIITADGEPLPGGAVGGGGGGGGGGTPPADGALANVPRKTVEDDGARMGAEVITAMRALRKPGAAPKTFAVVGSAVPLKELDTAKPIEEWTCIAAPKELTGAAATPELLFLNLPAFLAEKKPEIVILACTIKKERKANYAERYDWEDLARLCLRLGALPVLAVPPDKVDGPSRIEMLEAIKSANLPALEITAPVAGAPQISLAEHALPGAFPQRVAWIFGLLGRHVCGRAPASVDAPAKADKKTGAGEVE